MLDSKEISNNGTSWLEMVLGLFHKLLIVNSLDLVTNQNQKLMKISVSTYMNNVTTKV